MFISVTGWVLPGAADNLVGEDAADGPQSGVGPARTVLANAPRRLHPLWWQSRNGLAQAANVKRGGAPPFVRIKMISPAIRHVHILDCQ
jgi:hypothetical protein